MPPVAPETSHSQNPLVRGGEITFPKTAALLLLLILGAIEGWFTRTNFATDAISYLDISRAIPAGNWKLVFNPLWSAGYPLLLSVVRPFFPQTPGGEWLAIHVLNVFIFLATWIAFNYLLESPLSKDSAKPFKEEIQARLGFLRFAALFIFIAIQLCIDSVSRVGPDLLVTMLFFFSVAIMLRLLHKPELGRAAALGCVLGLGYWVKGIFLPLSLAVLAVTTAALLWKKQAIKPVFISLAAFVLISCSLCRRPLMVVRTFHPGRVGRAELCIPRQPVAPLDQLARRSERRVRHSDPSYPRGHEASFVVRLRRTVSQYLSPVRQHCVLVPGISPLLQSQAPSSWRSSRPLLSGSDSLRAADLLRGAAGFGAAVDSGRRQTYLAQKDSARLAFVHARAPGDCALCAGAS